MKLNIPDYIVIGAGSSGCVLANRLSENPENNVLLVEAGGKDTSPLIHIPGAYSLLNGTKVDWAFSTVPQPYVNDREMYCPRGKVLGGCSSTNAMAYVRGNAQDYDNWKALGNPGWGFNEVLPYFIKSEQNAQADQLDSGFHGTDGPLFVSYAQRYRTPLADAFVASCEAYGIPRTQDYNGKSQIGTSPFQFTIKDGKRFSAVHAFLKPARSRPNLQVLTHCTVRKLILKQDKVVGIEYQIGKGRVQTLKAKKEIILSAGAYASPQLLMLSGIGAKAELNPHGISCLHELPGVGKNLQDHLMTGVSTSVRGKTGFNHALSPFGKVKEGWNYVLSKNGILTCSPLEAVAFFNLADMTETPDFQFQFAPLHLGEDMSGVEFYNPKTFPYDTDGATILASLVSPMSRGELRLSSADPHAAPLIDNRFLEAEADRLAMVKGIRIALSVFEQDALQAYVTSNQHINLHSSDDEILAHVREVVETIYHPVGTCKMGGDELAVVDPELRVHGLEGLRVADASIMPVITTGNTNAPCYMIAEKCADMVLGKESPAAVREASV